MYEEARVNSGYPSDAKPARQQSPLEEAQARLSAVISEAEHTFDIALRNLEDRLGIVLTPAAPSTQGPNVGRDLVSAVERGGSDAVRRTCGQASELQRITRGFGERIQSLLERIEA